MICTDSFCFFPNPEISLLDCRGPPSEVSPAFEWEQRDAGFALQNGGCGRLAGCLRLHARRRDLRCAPPAWYVSVVRLFVVPACNSQNHCMIVELPSRYACTVRACTCMRACGCARRHACMSACGVWGLCESPNIVPLCLRVLKRAHWNCSGWHTSLSLYIYVFGLFIRASMYARARTPRLMLTYTGPRG